MTINVTPPITPNFLKTINFSGKVDQGPGLLNDRDLIAAQALSLCDTDQIADEIALRLRPYENLPPTILKSFKTDMLLTELTYRVQKITMILIETQNMMSMTQFLFSGGDLFSTDFQDLDGYNIPSGSIDD
jgi:hypothetical protein